MKLLVLGIGNPILGDDNVGLEVVNKLAEKKLENVVVKEASNTGLDIITAIAGYDKVIIIDGVKTGAKPGTVHRLTPENFKRTIRYSTHDLDLLTALELAKKMQIKMPKSIIIYGIEVREVGKFKIGLSKEVEESVPKVIELVLKEVK